LFSDHHLAEELLEALHQDDGSFVLGGRLSLAFLLNEQPSSYLLFKPGTLSDTENRLGLVFGKLIDWLITENNV